MRGQRREGDDGHVVTVVSNLGAASSLCSGHDLGSGLVIRVWNGTLRVVVVCPVLGTSPVLSVVEVTLLTLHDEMDATWRSVLAI
jgi:hypothetical protein